MRTPVFHQRTDTKKQALLNEFQGRVLPTFAILENLEHKEIITISFVQHTKNSY